MTYNDHVIRHPGYITLPQKKIKHRAQCIFTSIIEWSGSKIVQDFYFTRGGKQSENSCTISITMATTPSEISNLTVDDTSTATKDEQNEDKSPRRATWATQLDFIMTSVGCAVGLGNIWRFPYLCYKNGGGAFLIPYALSFFLAAAPTYIAEISLGQYTSCGVVQAWKMVPVFQGLGIASQVITLYTNVYYIVVVAWALYYIAVSFTSQLPWATCGNPWNSERCYVTGMPLERTRVVTNCTTIDQNVTDCDTYNVTLGPPVDAVVEYWERKVLNMSSGIHEPGSLVPGLAVALLVAWVLVYLCICRGVRWTGKIVYFTAVAPYFLLLVIFIRGITLKGAATGLIYYLKPDFSRLADAQVWMDGGTQVIYSIGVGQGFMITLGSYNKFKTNCVRNGLVIICINCLTSIFGGLAVFSILGFMSYEMEIPIEKVASQGPGLVFLAYPKAVTQMPLSPLWSVLFFLTILFVGLDSEFAGVEAVLTPFIDRFPSVLYKPRNRMIFVAVYCTTCFLIGLSMVTQGGVYLFRLIDYYCASGLVLLAMVFFEAVAIGWVFGADRFYDALEMMVGYRSGPWLKLSWKFLAPLIINGIFWFQLVKYKPLSFSETYEYPIGATVLGFIFTLSSISCVPISAIYYIATANGSLKQRLMKVTTPILKKHQINPRWKDSDYRWTLEEYKYHDVNNPFSIDDEINSTSMD
ncbi:sodium- and chloride-dependent GABA transporter 1-like [Mercenaria mercenaria]|uniref:sodium- and chloride-dependent GABA transporter 1-like n=1 Tax=Mercenaria mercenaria TaxID=6596 RepID=UPI00234F9633|nr:sodium- and chloride-dependent GABA transporter 1-like [Mercenaria mercenaria]